MVRNNESGVRCTERICKVLGRIKGTKYLVRYTRGSLYRDATVCLNGNE